MNEDCLKLTTYFGERDRTPDGLLADELLDIYGGHRLQVSVLLGGVEGFGRLHHVHTDRLLTLSEDLPVVSVAVDRRDRIESMLELVLQIKRRGLITLELARLLSGEIGAVALPEELGEATKLTAYATVLLGVDGTNRGRRTRAKFFARNADVPMMIIAVGAGEKIAQVLPELGGLLREPLMTLERVRVCKRDGELLARPHGLPGTDEPGLAMWQKLMVYTSQSAMHDGRPLGLEIVRRLRASDSSGATNLRGLWGFHGDHAPHGDKIFQLRRHVPVTTITVDTPERTARAFDIIDELTTEHGLVTSEMVPAMTAMSERAQVGGLKLANHDFDGRATAVGTVAHRVRTSPQRRHLSAVRRSSGPGAGALACHRTRQRCLTMLNAYPYASGHLMIRPARLAADLREMDDRELDELMRLTRRALRVRSAVMAPDGFNVGLNLGPAAGAGIAEHLHVHVVPRWEGRHEPHAGDRPGRASCRRLWPMPWQPPTKQADDLCRRVRSGGRVVVSCLRTFSQSSARRRS